MTKPPSVVDGPSLALTRNVEIDMPCPKCNQPIRITKVEAGAVIKCPHTKCGNITWRPTYVPPWWAKTKNFVIAQFGAFLLGIAASFIASILYTAYTDANSPSNAPVEHDKITQKETE